ncbi:MAG: class I SAM-dependent methyltransferase [Acidobacteria bacterium]|nr:MAG: class I SAM-dependent methyltransferase [Acidobacteriota bacterium]
MTGYSQDLAYIHDAGFSDFALRAAPGLFSILRRNQIPNGLVADLGCGSGVWARELLRAGYDVLGVDISPAMIKLARRKAPGAKFRTGSLLSVRLPRCDAVTSIGECLNYCFDQTNSKHRLRQFFRRLHQSLRAGGVFVFDVLEPGQLTKGAVRKNFMQGPDWAVFAESQEDQKRKILSRRITAFRRFGKLYRRSQETHRQRLYKASELTQELKRAGFNVQMLRGYGRFRFSDGHLVFAARKP